VVGGRWEVLGTSGRWESVGWLVIGIIGGRCMEMGDSRVRVGWW